MRLLSFIAVLFLAVSPSNAYQQKKPADSKHDIASPAPPAPPELTVIGQQQVGSTEKATKPNSNPQDWQEWVRPTTLVSIVLAGAAIWAGCIALKTLKTLKIQARAGLKAAIAAKMTAQAVINSERAWITVDISWCPGYPGPHFVDNMTNITIRWSCLNAGHTPALILEKRFKLQFLPLPTIPQLDDGIDSIDHETQSLAADREVHGEVGTQSAAPLPLVIYGVVKYTDVFESDKIRESYFAYTVTPMGNLERLPGYPEYNKYT